ncbi:MAG TPA: protocatechuate 3,4-dioxygenase subunit alpha [Ktedonobacterales bacterium]|jgi:protocatechuate 3,4-dioxygenase alpha subunit|nr:protocatechuate 3,4-dioxygenase subunit alpha [Ktedonobacterales bacterium]
MTPPTTPGLSPSQTVGPFFLDSLLREDARRNVLVEPQTQGERIRIEGLVLDGDGAPVPDALIEIWQANAFGRYRHPSDTRDLPLDPAFTGFGRSGTDAAGRFWFETIRPGAEPYDRQRMQAPHICVLVFARGLLNHLATRLYFDDEPVNADDPVLLLVPADRRHTLLARRDVADGRLVYRFDIILQGEGETAFFDQ